MISDWIAKRLGAGVSPITYKDVEPAPRPPEKEKAAQQSIGKLMAQVMATERTSVQVRRELAENALKLMAGE